MDRRILCLLLLGVCSALMTPVRLHGADIAVGDAFFARLARLEPADVSKASYVKLDGYRIGIEDMYGILGETYGNAWLIHTIESPDKQRHGAVFVCNGGEVIEIDDDNGYALPSAPTPSSQPEPFRRFRAHWVAADVGRETRGLLHFLNNDDYGESYWNCDDTWAKVLLFAFQLYQRGEVDTARTVQDALYRKVARLDSEEDSALDDSSPAQKITPAEVAPRIERAARNALANAQYRTLLHSFEKNPDWKSFQAGLGTLLARHDAWWDEAPGIRLLMERAGLRARDAVPESVATMSLSKEERRLAARMLDMRFVRTTANYQHGGPIWLIPSTWTSTPGIKDDVDIAIRARGMAAIPFLLDMASDPALTPVFPSLDDPAHRYYRFTSPGEKRDPQESFDSQPRPCTRGEVATMILAEMLPKSVREGSSGQRSGEVLWDAAKAFHKTHAQSPEEDLLMLFLAEDLNQIALAHLFRAASKKPLPSFETFLIKGPATTDERMSSFDGVPWARIAAFIKYAGIRGSGAQPLVMQFAEQLKANAQAFQMPKNVSYGSPEANQKHVEDVRKQLLDAANRLAALKLPDSDEQSLASAIAADGTTQGMDICNMNQARYNIKNGNEALSLLLTAAAAEQDAVRRGRIGIEMLCLDLLDADPFFQRQTLDPRAHADLWKTLIADAREGFSKKPVCHTFLELNEKLFARVQPLPGREIPRRHTFLFFGYPEQMIRFEGAAGTEFVRRRVTLRLDGSPEADLPKYPCEISIAESDRNGIRTAFAAAATRDDAARRASSQPHLRHAVMQDFLLQEPALNARLTPLANTIVRVDVQEDDVLAKRLASWIGAAMTPEKAEELRTHALAQSKAGCLLLCLASRSEDFGGWDILVRPATAEESRGLIENSVYVTGMVCAPDHYETDSWSNPSADSTPNRNDAAAMEKSESAYATMQRSILSAHLPANAPAFIRYLAKGAFR